MAGAAEFSGIDRMAAMLAAWTLPRDVDRTTIDAIAKGQRAACDALGASIVGGNLSTGDSVSLTTTALGAVTRPISRKGAKNGEILVVAGAVGEAALGLSSLMRGREEGEAARLVRAWRRPAVLSDASRSLARIASAMIDVSDGLAQ